MCFCDSFTAVRDGVPLLCFVAVYGVSYCRRLYYNRYYPYQKLLTEGTYYEGCGYEKSQSVCVAVPPNFRSKEGIESCPCLSGDNVITLKMPMVKLYNARMQVPWANKAERNEKMEEEKIARKEEVLEYLTNVMRDAGVDEKTRMKASEQLGKYLGMDALKGRTDDKLTVTICDDISGK